MPSAMEIRLTNLADQQVKAMIRLHLKGMHANSPNGHVFALDSAGLAGDDITLFGAWDGPFLLGIGALKALSPKQGEVKSMRVPPEASGQGIGKAILEVIISTAMSCGYETLSLETGSGEGFAAAISLYLKRGFKKGDVFGDYVASDFNQFFHLSLQSETKG